MMNSCNPRARSDSVSSDTSTTIDEGELYGEKITKIDSGMESIDSFDTSTINSGSSPRVLYSKFSGRFENPVVTPGLIAFPSFPGRTTRVHQFTIEHEETPPTPTDIEEAFPSGNNRVKLFQVLKSHQIASITLCSVFGSGLLVNTAETLHECGPLPLLLSYLLLGSLGYQVVDALSEMCAYIPLPNAYSGYSERFVDPALGYTLGYLYLFQYLIIGPSQIFAGSMTVQYWVSSDKVSPAVWISLFIVVLTLLNFIDVGKIAVVADVFLMIKLVIYFFIIVLLLVIVCGGNKQKSSIGFRFWKDPGVINYSTFSTFGTSSSGFLASISAITNAVFSFVGVESFCVTVGEAKNPRKSIPKAKNIVFVCISLAYIPFIVLIGMSVAYTDSGFPSVVQHLEQNSVQASAMILAIKNAGMKVIPSLLNGCIFVFVISSASSSYYISTRILYGLSACGLAPKIFSKTSSQGIPLFAIVLVVVFNLLAYLGVSESSKQLFELFSNSVCGISLILWAAILLTHVCFIRAMNVQKVERNTSYRSRGGMAASAIGLVVCLILIFFREFRVFLDIHNMDYQRLMTGYFCIPIFVILYLVFKLYYKTPFITLSTADLFFYKDRVDASEEAYLNQELEDLKADSYESKYSIRKWYNRLLV